jgi:hypothetical protein
MGFGRDQMAHANGQSPFIFAKGEHCVAVSGALLPLGFPLDIEMNSTAVV